MYVYALRGWSKSRKVHGFLLPESLLATDS